MKFEDSVTHVMKVSLGPDVQAYGARNWCPSCTVAADCVSLDGMPDNAATIIYDIDMLDYCFERLRGPWRRKGKEYNLCLEGFLLHYRNLIEFFASHGKGLRADNPEEWTSTGLSQEDVDSIRNVKLFETYHSDISQHLTHSGKARAEGVIHWKPVEMYEQIGPLLGNFRKLFPSVPRPEASILSAIDASTASLSILPSSAVLDSEAIALGGKPREIADEAREQQDDSTET